ncbi:hypothetical protein BY996DRAFT_6414840 [Phakopsora pachyrhizi]|uniref:Expressed protein n=1 Tax=Phakopsora pachyrhizi TaxID=170000 RepID=A0AAV0BK69_PHAPC|nr:hypothetical protein BY996DRAFT_6414840 [Phakopsora pachyrhizi]CAH7686993.1 expressed protein [Phakopsora pachyrhizi]
MFRRLTLNNSKDEKFKLSDKILQRKEKEQEQKKFKEQSLDLGFGTDSSTGTSERKNVKKKEERDLYLEVIIESLPEKICRKLLEDLLVDPLTSYFAKDHIRNQIDCLGKQFFEILWDQLESLIDLDYHHQKLAKIKTSATSSNVNQPATISSTSKLQSNMHQDFPEQKIHDDVDMRGVGYQLERESLDYSWWHISYDFLYEIPKLLKFPDTGRGSYDLLIVILERQFMIKPSERSYGFTARWNDKADRVMIKVLKKRWVEESENLDGWDIEKDLNRLRILGEPFEQILKLGDYSGDSDDEIITDSEDGRAAFKKRQDRGENQFFQGSRKLLIFFLKQKIRLDSLRSDSFSLNRTLPPTPSSSSFQFKN